MNDPIRAQLARNRDAVVERIGRAARRAGRGEESVTLVAITKSVPPEIAAELPAIGVLELGENRVRELERKADACAAATPRPRWHLVGPIQTNKARKAIHLADVLHAVDREDLLARLDRVAQEERRPARCLLEVNVSGESSKHGFAPSAVPAALRAAQKLTALRVIGLMTMAPLGAAEPELRAVFRGLRSLRDEAAADGLFAPGARDGGELSMGMSSDFEIAVEEGATFVRVGSALFENLPIRPAAA